jgi:hypothetical protein
LRPQVSGADGYINSPQRKLWEQMWKINTEAANAGDINYRDRYLCRSSGASFCLIDALPTACAVGYGYIVGFADWLSYFLTRLDRDVLA